MIDSACRRLFKAEAVGVEPWRDESWSIEIGNST